MLDKKLRSFGYAFSGIRIAWQEEFNFRFEVVCAIAALAAAIYFQLPREELLTIVFLIGFVLTAEVFNTALEELCDKFSPTHDPHIAKIKDLAAGAVFIAAITALVIGAKIFLPYVVALSA